MVSVKPKNFASRRKFISSISSAACLLCLCPGTVHSSFDTDSTDDKNDKIHRFLKDSHMTYEEVFKYTYASWFIPAMKILAEDMGERELNEMLRKISSEVARRKGEAVKTKIPENSLSVFAGFFEKPSPRLENGTTYEIVEKSGTVLELKVTECLWAKVFRGADAAGIGYSYICFPDYSMVQGFNPKIVLSRDKTLMQGHNCCNHRYEMKV